MEHEEINILPTFQEAFARVLECAALIYEAHNSEKGDSWKDVPIIELEEFLHGELEEYLCIFDTREMFFESLDIVNFALMIATRRMMEVERL